MQEAVDGVIRLVLVPAVALRPAVANVNVSVRDSTTTSSLQRFNPFTQTPVEGINWQKGPNFGKARNNFDYPTPREYLFAAGFRF